MAISNSLILLYKIAALRLLPWIPNGQSTSWATLSTRDARGAGSGMYAENAGAFFCRNDSYLLINQRFPTVLMKP